MENNIYDFDKLKFEVKLGGKIPIIGQKTGYYDGKLRNEVVLPWLNNTKVWLDYDKYEDTLTIHSNPIKALNNNISFINTHVTKQQFKNFIEGLAVKINLSPATLFKGAIKTLDIKNDRYVRYSIELLKDWVVEKQPFFNWNKFENTVNFYAKRTMAESDLVIKLYDKLVESNGSIHDNLLKLNFSVQRLEASFQKEKILAQDVGIKTVEDLLNESYINKLIHYINHMLQKIKLEYSAISEFKQDMNLSNQPGTLQSELMIYEGIKRRGGIDACIQEIKNTGISDRNGLLTDRRKRLQKIYDKFAPFDYYNLNKQEQYQKSLLNFK